MRFVVLGIVFFLFSCAGLQTPEKKVNLAYGGAFEVGNPITEPTFIKHLDSPIVEVELNDSMIEVLRDSFKMYPIVLDSIVADSLRNGADKEYAAAAKQLETYRKYKSNLWRYVFIYCLITLPLLIVSAIFISTVMATAGVLMLILLVLLLGAIINLWIIGLAILLLLPKLMLKSAIRSIKTAPERAPAKRRIEYEVRSLLMLKSFLTKRYVRKRIEKIRLMAQTDPYNPWLKKLEVFEQPDFHFAPNKKLRAVLIFIGLYLFLVALVTFTK